MSGNDQKNEGPGLGGYALMAGAAVGLGALVFSAFSETSENKPQAYRQTPQSSSQTRNSYSIEPQLRREGYPRSPIASNSSNNTSSNNTVLKPQNNKLKCTSCNEELDEEKCVTPPCKHKLHLNCFVRNILPTGGVCRLCKTPFF